jgi:hypothetical protein
MMTRTQITLEPEMLRQARKRAAQLGISLAKYIRRLIAKSIKIGSDHVILLIINPLSSNERHFQCLELHFQA